MGHRVCNGVDNVGVGHALSDRRLKRLAIPHDDCIQIINDLQKTSSLDTHSICLPFQVSLAPFVDIPRGWPLHMMMGTVSSVICNSTGRCCIEL